MYLHVVSMLGFFQKGTTRTPMVLSPSCEKGQICFIEDMLTLSNSRSKKELLRNIIWSYFASCAPTSSLRLCLCCQMQVGQSICTDFQRCPSHLVLCFRCTGGELRAAPGRYLVSMTEGSRYKGLPKKHISHTLDRSRVTHILWKYNL